MSFNNINDLFASLKEENSKNDFALINGKTISYRQLLSEIDKLHVLFADKGLQKGDKVIVSLQDEYYTSIFFIAFLRYGITTVFIDPDVPCFRAVGIINTCDAKGFVMDEELFSARKIEDNPNLFTLKVKKETQKKGKLFKKLLKKEVQNQDTSSFPAVLNSISTTLDHLPEVQNDDLAYILFTSGTSSNPKGVMITHLNVFTHLKTLSKVYKLNEESKLHNILMLYHVDGIIQGPFLALFNKAQWIRPFSFDLAKIGDLFNSIYKYRITHFITVPTVLSFMKKFSQDYTDSFKTEDFKTIISVASKLESKLWSDIQSTFDTDIVNVYGLTETVTGSLFSSKNMGTEKVGSVGKPIDCEVKLLNNNNEISNANEPGVLWIKGDHIFKGYSNNEQATKEVLIDGWLNTGDVATFDENGFYTIIGREKFTVNAGGVNIYPEQVTEIINMNPEVLESISLGIPDDNFGEKLVAAVVLKNKGAIDKIELLEFIRPYLELNQVPKEVYFFDELPKGLSSKIQIKGVENLILSLEHTNVQHNTKTSHDGILKKAAANAFNMDIQKISMNDDSTSIDGWDSMGHLNFVTNIEEELGIKFSTAEMMTMNSLESSKKILQKKQVSL